MEIPSFLNREYIPPKKPPTERVQPVEKVYKKPAITKDPEGREYQARKPDPEKNETDKEQFLNKDNDNGLGGTLDIKA